MIESGIFDFSQLPSLELLSLSLCEDALEADLKGAIDLYTRTIPHKALLSVQFVHDALATSSGREHFDGIRHAGLCAKLDSALHSVLIRSHTVSATVAVTRNSRINTVPLVTTAIRNAFPTLCQFDMLRMSISSGVYLPTSLI